MAIERDFVIARPGLYHYSWGDMEKTAEDLAEIPKYCPTVKITLGHPEGGHTRRRDFLGYAKPVWDAKNNALIGKGWFYDEHFHKVPTDIAERIINFEPWKISPGFTLDDDASFTTGVQEGTFLDHIAILRENDDPRCPLGQCGVNVVLQESESAMPKFIYEQATPSIYATDNSEGKGPLDTPAKEAVEPEPDVDVAALQKEVAELREKLKSLEGSPEQKPVENTIPEEQPPVKRADTEPVPETEIPYGDVPGKFQKGTRFNKQGHLKIIYQPRESVG